MNERFDWESLRHDVADVQRPFAEDEQVAQEVRARLLLATAPPVQRSWLRPLPFGETGRRTVPRPWAKTWAVLAAAAITVLGVAYLGSRPEPALSFSANGSGAPARIGDLLSASPAQAMPLRFSDGTVVSMAAATRARVVRTTAHGADIVLEQGSLSLRVTHHTDTEWHVGAGPFTVLVTGTKFDVGWNASERTFTLALHEGAVEVRGPKLGAGGRWVKLGEELRIALDETAVATPSPATNEAIPSSQASATVAPKGVRGAPLGSWKELARTERYAEALAAAEADGFEATCAAASARDLLLLGNAARFAGSAPRAEQAFRLVRSRFAGSHEAGKAAFLLGRLAYDQRGNRAEAARWFQSYLREEPAGEFAREAAGRLLEAQRALGDREAARAAARAYLEKYPSGPHAGLARESLKP